jgi:hypothetical protein
LLSGKPALTCFGERIEKTELSRSFVHKEWSGVEEIASRLSAAGYKGGIP